MKKILVTTALCLVGVSLMAQGRINFNNANATSPLRINNGGIEWDSANLSAAPIITPGPTTQILGTASTATFGYGPASAQIRLYGGATSSSLAPLLIGTGANAAFVPNSANSTLASAQGTFPGGSTLNIGAVSPMFLRFTATINDTLSRQVLLGVSPIIMVTPTLAPATAAATFAATADASHWNGLTLYYIPEPSTFALAGLGAAAMLIFRRRK
jgi:hypothetical protein